MQFQKIVDIVIKICLLYIYWTSLHILVLWGLKRVIVYTHFSLIFEMYYCIKANLTYFFEVHLYFLEHRNRKKLRTWNRKKFHTENRIWSKNCKTDKNFQYTIKQHQRHVQVSASENKPGYLCEKGCKGENIKWVGS